MENFEELENYQKQLDTILKGCNTCKAKLCDFCPNGKRKKSLRSKIKMLSPTKETWFEKLKKFFS
ncbi:hypothetical protein [Fusobacterium sp.]|uniref:hypothetical protein n=1 Tax=Fusobacterium sp. TaxID=68766 RepID=UPI002614861A|nr:hypothetical protein [Fusobacterium sp.]